MTYIPPNKLVMRIEPTTMGASSDGRRSGASHWTDNRRSGSAHYAVGDAGDGLGDFWGSVGTALGAGVNIFKPKDQTVVAPAPTSGGIDTTTVLLLGALGLGAFFVYKKMKKNRR